MILDCFSVWAGAKRLELAKHGVEAQLTVCEPTGNRALRLDVETATHLARVIVWASGDIHLEMVDTETGATIVDQVLEVEHPCDFEALLKCFFEKMDVA